MMLDIDLPVLASARRAATLNLSHQRCAYSAEVTLLPCAPLNFAPHLAAHVDYRCSRHARDQTEATRFG
jgi:hypothetical protein